MSAEPGGTIACPRCGAPVGPQQDWCLQCGVAARTRLVPTPNWRLPVATLLVTAALALAALAVAFVTLTDDDPVIPAATTAPPTTVTETPVVPETASTLPTVTTPPSTTAPAIPTTPAPSGTATTPAPTGGGATPQPTIPATGTTPPTE